MQRRKFLATVGSLAAGSAAAIGTGAFTKVEAARAVSVNTTGDRWAYLKLSGDGEYVTNDNTDELTIDLGNLDNGKGGKGFNQNAATVVHSVISIENQGSNNVSIDLEYSGDGKVVDEVDDANLNWNEGVYFELRDGGYGGNGELSPGQKIDVDVAVVENAGGSGVTGGNLTIKAEE